MWTLLVLIIFSIFLSLYIRRNKLLRTHLYSKLYSVGLQLGTHIHTPVCDVLTDFRHFDLVILRLHHGHLHGYRIFHREHFQIPLNHVEVGHQLVYQGPADHMYMEGTPFKVHKGVLILYKLRRKGLSFVSEEVSRSTQWPM